MDLTPRGSPPPSRGWVEAGTGGGTGRAILLPTEWPHQRVPCSALPNVGAGPWGPPSLEREGLHSHVNVCIFADSWRSVSPHHPHLGRGAFWAQVPAQIYHHGFRSEHPHLTMADGARSTYLGPHGQKWLSGDWEPRGSLGQGWGRFLKWFQAGIQTFLYWSIFFRAPGSPRDLVRNLTAVVQ